MGQLGTKDKKVKKNPIYYLQSIGDDVWELILSLLSARDICALQQTCKFSQISIEGRNLEENLRQRRNFRFREGL